MTSVMCQPFTVFGLTMAAGLWFQKKRFNTALQHRFDTLLIKFRNQHFIKRNKIHKDRQGLTHTDQASWILSVDPGAKSDE